MLKALLLPAILSWLLYISQFLLFLTPLPFFYGAKVWSWRFTLVSWVLGLVGFYFSLKLSLFSPSQEVLMAPAPRAILVALFGSWSVLGLFLAHLEKNAQSYLHLVFQAVLASLLVGALVLVVATGFDLKALWVESKNWLEAFQEAFLKEIGRQSPSQLKMIEESAPLIASYLVRFIPGLSASFLLFGAFINVLICRRFFILKGFFPKLPPFERFSLPFATVWISIALVGFLLIEKYLNIALGLTWVAANGLSLLTLLYFFQGIALLSFFMQRLLPPGLIRVAFFLLFLVFLQVLGPILVGVSFFDSWLHLRERFLKRKKG